MNIKQSINDFVIILHDDEYSNGCEHVNAAMNDRLLALPDTVCSVLCFWDAIYFFLELVSLMHWVR